MTDLQTSLIVIGGVIVAGVIGYNKWHEHRAKKNVERAFSSEPDDVLMTPTAYQPSATSVEPEVTAVPAQVASDERHEPVFSEQEFVLPEESPDLPVAEAATASEAAATSASLPVDAKIDCVIPLSFEGVVKGEKLLPLIQALNHVGNKPVHFMGYVEAEGWQPISPAGTYRELQAGVQLANRSGALNELEYSEMVMRLRHIADEIGAEPGIPDMPRVMVDAKTLRQFVIDHDVKLGINVRSNGAPWAIGTLLTALERQGFDVRPDGRFAMLDAEGTPLFTLTTNETVAAEHTPRLTLLLDVPRVAPGQNGFDAMIDCARTLVKRLDGTIVDDSDQRLTDEVLQDIASQVNAFYDDMELAGIAAGSVRARRLFI
ncbi:MAG: cell division protein [Burkholderiaceae bacterium]|nr:cell division protein [Burkholderiaceae bacterium]